MSVEVQVYVDLRGQCHHVGRLWARSRAGRQSATFEYMPDWLRNPECFALEPALTVGSGPHHTQASVPLFGAIADSAPDRWGRILMRRIQKGNTAGAQARTLQEIDYLLGVHDVSRLGALRFSLSVGGPFLAESDASTIPPFVSLARLLNASERVVLDKDSEDDIRLLLAPGSSLGGARPKASVWGTGGGLSLAKFPSPHDEWDVVRWESVALSLASSAGIRIPEWSLERVAGKPVLLLVRFDRMDAQTRIPFLSAMSMLGAKDMEPHSYLEIADLIRRYGAETGTDMRQLFRRIIFNVLISNTDDHLRNHGFLLATQAGWRLSPAYDLNPVPPDIKPRILSTSIGLEDATASLKSAFDVADYFGLSLSAARSIAGEVGTAVSTWRNVARGLGIPANEIERMSGAFEHADLQLALTTS